MDLFVNNNSKNFLLAFVKKSFKNWTVTFNVRPSLCSNSRTVERVLITSDIVVFHLILSTDYKSG